MSATTASDRHRLMAAAWPRGDRDSLLVYMMTEKACLRAREIVLLRAGDVNRPGRMFRVRTAAGTRPRWRAVPAELVRRASAYAARRKLDPESWLFPSSNPVEHLSVRQAARVLEAVRRQVEKGRFRELGLPGGL